MLHTGVHVVRGLSAATLDAAAATPVQFVAANRHSKRDVAILNGTGELASNVRRQIAVRVEDKEHAVALQLLRGVARVLVPHVPRLAERLVTAIGADSGAEKLEVHVLYNRYGGKRAASRLPLFD